MSKCLSFDLQWDENNLSLNICDNKHADFRVYVQFQWVFYKCWLDITNFEYTIENVMLSSNWAYMYFNYYEKANDSRSLSNYSAIVFPTPTLNVFLSLSWLLTDGPMYAKVYSALCTLVISVLILKVLAMWDTNSTDIPIACVEHERKKENKWNSWD